MARIRTIKPEFWKHEGLCSLPESTHMFAAALLNYADDFGYFNANPGLIKGEIYPLREPSVSIPESIRSLQTDGYIRLGTIDGRRYGHIIAFEDHQRVSHPTPSKISCLPIAWDISGIILEELSNSPETFVPEQGTGNGTGNREQGKDRASGAPPPKAKSRRSLPEGFPDLQSQDWSRDHWLTKGRADLCDSMTEEIANFRDHHAGKATMSADWAGSWRTWARNAMNFTRRPNGINDGKRNSQSHTATDQHLAGIAELSAELRQRRA